MSITPEQIQFWEKNGYLVIDNLLSDQEVAAYQAIYERFLDGTIDAGTNRSDLGLGLEDANAKEKENITQIMWLSDFVPGITTKSYHQKALSNV